MTKDIAGIARASFDAYVSKDRDAIERIIADDFHFTSPLDNRIDRKTYFERCWPNSQNIERFDFIHVTPVGNRVFITYEGQAKDRTFRNTEIMTIRGGQIIEVEVYFGWSLPHRAAPGSYVTDSAKAKPAIKQPTAAYAGQIN